MPNPKQPTIGSAIAILVGILTLVVGIIFLGVVVAAGVHNIWFALTN